MEIRNICSRYAANIRNDNNRFRPPLQAHACGSGIYSSFSCRKALKDRFDPEDHWTNMTAD